jgi:predicted lipase
MAEKETEINVGSLISKDELEAASSYFNVKNLLLNPPIKRAAYSDRMAWMMASMAQLVYERFEDGGKARELLQIKLKAGGFELIAEFNAPETDTQAFLVSNGEYAVLAFRGTEVTKKTDITTDIKATKVSIIEGRVHRGFLEGYNSIKDDILEALKKVLGLPIYITGHSLGAALATVATNYLENEIIKGVPIRDQIAACYTFGSPRVGNKQYDSDFKSPIYRMVNTTDIVTVVPLLAMGYIHIGDVRFLGPSMGNIRRGIPILQRIYFFLMAAFRLFGPLVGDHAIDLYRKKLEAIAKDHNRELYYDGRSGGR